MSRFTAEMRDGSKIVFDVIGHNEVDDIVESCAEDTIKKDYNNTSKLNNISIGDTRKMFMPSKISTKL